MNVTVWSLLALLAAGQGLFLTVLLFSKKENRLPNRLLASLLLLLAVTLTEWTFWWSNFIERAPVMMAVSFSFPLLYGPLLFLFYRATFERKPLNVRAMWHFLPWLFTVFLMLPFYLRFFENIAAALDWIPPLTRKAWFPLPIFAQMIAYGVWIERRFRRHFLENEELRRWHRWLLAAYWGIVAAYLFYRLMPNLGLTADEWKYLVAGSLTVFIYGIAWLGYAEPGVFAGLPLPEAMTPPKYRKSSLRAEQSAALFRRAADLVQSEQLYRDGQLSLELLAEKLGEPRHHLSQAINEQSGRSFSEFVNEQRIGAARQLLAQTSKQELNIIEVAYETGFNSKKAFNLAFKKHTGMTPTEYRQSNGEI